MKLVKLTCPNCNGVYEVNPNQKEFKCKYCGTTTLLDDESVVVKNISSKLEDKLNEIEEYYENGNYNKASKLAKKLLEEYPNNRKVLKYIKKEEEERKQKQGGKILGFIFILLICAIVGIPIYVKSSAKKTYTRIEEIGTKFYENFYYVASIPDEYKENKADYLAQYKENGLKVSLDNLLRYYVTTDDYKQQKEAIYEAYSITDKVQRLEKDWFSNCDKNDTKVIIYPYEPYGSSDYKIEIIIVR